MTTTVPTETGLRARLARASRRMRRVPGTVTVSALLLLAVAVLVVVPVAPHALDQDILLGTTPAGTPGHPLGTDSLGRDVLALTLAGARSAIVGPLVVALGSMVLGIVLGTLAGYRGGWVDAVISRYVDLTLAMPALLLAIVVAGVVGGGYWITVLVLVVLFSPSDIRIVRGAVLQHAHRPYIESTRVLGLPAWRVMMRHILPNVRPLVLTTMFLNIAYALVSMSGLTYLGLGVSPGAADWGLQLSDGRDLLWTNPAASVVPGLAIILVATAVNLVGDHLSERLDRGEDA
ncbi:ABC transporter permease [Sanguibacter sp. HDW7]|uniref:ABC transporter permease n=1 Tax=Sanguibacter sp. HDW7 TaxID=2714931 RepID=UPI00140CF3AF|nr:ABC transporter permease [Sanguibacter sp. HDW7]QIK82245.1 ABC transporter permease [Sanguibacter sp. HDW7]